MLFQLNVVHKVLLRVSYNVVYNNFQDILVSLRAMYSALENKKFLKSISIHFNCSFMQLKQQTSGHNNISLLAVFIWVAFYVHWPKVYNHSIKAQL